MPLPPNGVSKHKEERKYRRMKRLKERTLGRRKKAKVKYM